MARLSPTRTNPGSRRLGDLHSSEAIDSVAIDKNQRTAIFTDRRTWRALCTRRVILEIHSQDQHDTFCAVRQQRTEDTRHAQISSDLSCQLRQATKQRDGHHHTRSRVSHPSAGVDRLASSLRFAAAQSAVAPGHWRRSVHRHNGLTSDLPQFEASLRNVPCRTLCGSSTGGPSGRNSSAFNLRALDRPLAAQRERPSQGSRLGRKASG